MKLYFIAVIPDDVLCERITALKNELRDRYGVRHALKSPPHITLMMPFKFDEAREIHLHTILHDFAVTQTKFEVNLNGFDFFEPRVIFVKVMQHEQLQQLHRQLIKTLIDALNFDKNLSGKRFHPHITIATRDLKKDVFYRVKDLYVNRSFQADFKIDKIWLLKHNGKNWDKHQAFNFG